MNFPAKSPALRRSLARRDICPECGGALDTGWECNVCGYDAKFEATEMPLRGVAHHDGQIMNDGPSTSPQEAR